MATASGVLVELARGSPVRVSSRQRERLFFSGMVLALMVTVFWGFAPSFYLHGVLDSPNVLTPSLVVHGTVQRLDGAAVRTDITGCGPTH